MDALTYAKVGGPPDDWAKLQVRDRKTGDLVEAVEVNTAQGWAIIRNPDGSLPEGRTFGRFAIERQP